MRVYLGKGMQQSTQDLTAIHATVNVFMQDLQCFSSPHLYNHLLSKNMNGCWSARSNINCTAAELGSKR